MVSADRKCAMLAMTREFCDGGYKRGRVLLTMDWYDPTVVAELSR